MLVTILLFLTFTHERGGDVLLAAHDTFLLACSYVVPLLTSMTLYCTLFHRISLPRPLYGSDNEVLGCL